MGISKRYENPPYYVKSHYKPPTAHPTKEKGKRREKTPSRKLK